MYQGNHTNISYWCVYTSILVVDKATYYHDNRVFYSHKSTPLQITRCATVAAMVETSEKRAHENGLCAENARVYDIILYNTIKHTYWN